LRAEAGFREDLYYRLNVSQLHIPPLRDRLEDVPLLFAYYVERCALQHERDPRQATEHDRRMLQRYGWPGNVRELRNIAMRFALDSRVQLADVLFPKAAVLQSSRLPDISTQPLGVQVGAFEAEVIRQCLTRHGGNIKAVLDELDLPRRTLNQKMIRYGINRADFIQAGSPD
jgi:two-component system C4-dicarboxylate transport response regulator DctD